MYTSRKDFIKITSLAAASLLPVARALANELDARTESLHNLLDGNFNSQLQFRVIANNLLNLNFYFINVQARKGWMYPLDCTEKSYMLVRLPTQHVSEKGFFTNSKGEIIWSDNKAELSGFSFLAFQLWPEYDATNCQYVKRKKGPRIRFSTDEFLDWNNAYNFKLTTLVEWLQLNGKDLNNGLDFVPLDKIPTQKNGAVSPGTAEKWEPQTEIFRQYKARISQLLYHPPSQARFVPVTLFEVPNKLLLVPFFRTQLTNAQQVIHDKSKLRFFKNEGKPRGIYNKSAGTLITKYEIWHNTLQSASNMADPAATQQSQFVIENPSFRAIGIIAPDESANLDDNITCKTIQQLIDQCKKDSDKTDKNILPTLLDKKEIAFLTQFAKIKGDPNHDFTTSDFDIKELNGFFFTGLGVIAHLKYNNVEKKPAGVDLIEYEHIITQGRDIFIKVARLGYNSKTGQKYKHIIEAKRKIDLEKILKDGPKEPVSFLEIKQYCECIDKEIIYDENNVNAADRFKIIAPTNSEIVAGGIANTDWTCRNLPYTSLRTVEKKRTPIDLLQDTIIKPLDQYNNVDLCQLESTMWFWPVKEADNHTDKFPAPLIDISEYQPCEFDFIDWEGYTHSAATPFMFIRASLLECAKDENDAALKAVYNNYLQGKSDSATGAITLDQQVFFNRRKTLLDGKKIAFTPSVANKTNNESKVNILESDFIDLFFVVENAKGSAAQKVPLIVLPQLLRAGVYFDHVRDLTQQKLISVVEYHDAHRKYGLSDARNGALQILQITKSFEKLAEEVANNKYAEISNAIRDAKDKLGNIVTPDISPDSLSLDRFGITLPKQINPLNSVTDALGKLQHINPIEILRGKFSEIMGGIDLRQILLGMIPADESPLFEINKFINEIDDSIKNSSVYKQIEEEQNNAIQTIHDKVDALTKLRDQAKAAVDTKQAEIAQYVNDLKTKVNSALDVEATRNILKSKFEECKTSAFRLLLDDIHFNEVRDAINKAKADIDTFIDNELDILRGEYQAKYSELISLNTELNNELALLSRSLPVAPDFVNLRGLITDGILATNVDSIFKTYKNYFKDAAARTNLDADIKGWKHNIFKTVDDVTPYQFGTDVIWFNSITLTFEKAPASGGGGAMRIAADPLLQQFFISKIGNFDAGYAQLNKKVNDLQLFISKNINGNQWQKDIVKDIQNNFYQPYKAQLDVVEKNLNQFNSTLTDQVVNIKTWLNNTQSELLLLQGKLNPEAQNSIAKLQALAAKANHYVDFLRKIDPDFYYQENIRLRKDVNDLITRLDSEIAKNLKPIVVEAEGVKSQIQQAYDDKVKAAEQTYVAAIRRGNAAIGHYKQAYEAQKATITKDINDKAEFVITQLKNTPGYKEAQQLLTDLKTARQALVSLENTYDTAQKSYTDYLNAEKNNIANKARSEITAAINKFIGKHSDEVALVNQAKNLLKLLTSLKQQDLTYKWGTTSFQDVNLGIIAFKKFSNPDTRLSVDVRVTIKFTPGKFPPTIAGIETYSQNRLSNFGISIFNILIIGFSELSFVAGSSQHPHFDVKIKNVQFNGALAFVQKFQEFLKTLGAGLILKLEADHIELGYALPIPSIRTPAFSFFNLTLAFKFLLFFDKRAMRFGFSLATPENKFGIAVYIFAGFGYFSIVAEPKRGIVEIDAALEAGVWTGFSLGPIHGEVKLAFGFRYTKGDFGTRLEGYIVAEGRLTVWIIEVSARIYVGIISQNSYAEGECVVTYSVKLGFFKMSFTGTFHKKIAGAETNANNGEHSDNNRSLTRSYFNAIANTLVLQNKSSMDTPLTILKQFGKNDKSKAAHEQSVAQRIAPAADIPVTYCVTAQDWEDYFKRYKL